jgi:hypothetical protein
MLLQMLRGVIRIGQDVMFGVVVSLRGMPLYARVKTAIVGSLVVD